jgi:hypothetical protein
MSRTNYRKLWEEAHGPIPREPNGRAYEIHHANGNHHDNRLENLECLTISQHYERHLEMGDPFGAMLIAQRMGKTPAELSALQTGVKRKPETCLRISQVKKEQYANGLVPSFKNKRHSETTKQHWSKIRTGVRHSSKLQQVDVDYIRKVLADCPILPPAKRRSTYEFQLAKHLVKTTYPHLTAQCIFKVLTGQSWA